eukprot:14773-Heterococcus_DN1.PRE.3
MMQQALYSSLLPRNRLTVSKKAVPVASECPSTSTRPSIARRPLSSSASEVSPGLKAGIRPITTCGSYRYIHMRHKRERYVLSVA